MKIIMQKNATNIYCCCVPEKVETKSARPRTAIRKMNELRKSKAMLPTKGILKTSLPIIRPKRKINHSNNQEGNHFCNDEFIFSYRCNINLFNCTNLLFPYHIKSCKQKSNCSYKYSENSRQHIVLVIKHFIVPVPVCDLDFRDRFHRNGFQVFGKKNCVIIAEDPIQIRP